MATRRLLTRDEFRIGVFTRDSGACVLCRASGVDAHHIMERRLFTAPGEQGGYFIDNGATVCEPCHLACERTDIPTETVRAAAGIQRVVLPEDFYEDQVYTKWGDIVQPNGQRLRGPLFYDESVQKIISAHLLSYTHLVKAPRTHHLPWSPGVSPDDRVIPDMAAFKGQPCVITLKKDGANTSLYADACHGRAIDGRDHSSMHWVKGFHARIAFEIPPGWRIVGENLFARHSIAYRNLKSYFLGFQVWDDRNVCLPWAETLEWFALLGITPVETVWEGIYDEHAVRAAGSRIDLTQEEGYVLRVSRSFTYAEYKICVGKYVRRDHNHLHNKRAMIVERNGLLREASEVA